MSFIFCQEPFSPTCPVNDSWCHLITTRSLIRQTTQNESTGREFYLVSEPNKQLSAWSSHYWNVFVCNGVARQKIKKALHSISQFVIHLKYWFVLQLYQIYDSISFWKVVYWKSTLSILPSEPNVFPSTQLFQYCSFAWWNVSIWPCSTEIA